MRWIKIAAGGLVAVGVAVGIVAAMAMVLSRTAKEEATTPSSLDRVAADIAKLKEATAPNPPTTAAGGM